MLTPKENFLETIRGGNPDRFVKQYEFFEMPWSDPFNATNPAPTEPGQAGIVDFWGVTWDWPEGTPGAFPNHTGDLIVLEDVCDWREVHQPTHEYAEDVWAAAEAEYGAVDRTQKFVGPLMFPGLFELTHALMGMENACCALLEVTQRCNLHCRFCFADGGTDTPDPPLEEMKAAIREITLQCGGKLELE